MARRRICVMVVTGVIALAAASCGGTSTATTSDTPAVGSAVVTIDGFAFSPSTITVTAGTEVTWRNLQGSPHTATGDAAEFDSPQLAQDEEFSQVFDTPGEYTYHCEIHPNMTGVVIVEP